jgi:hypothetical protein
MIMSMLWHRHRQYHDASIFFAVAQSINTLVSEKQVSCIRFPFFVCYLITLVHHQLILQNRNTVVHETMDTIQQSAVKNGRVSYNPLEGALLSLTTSTAQTTFAVQDKLPRVGLKQTTPT